MPARAPGSGPQAVVFLGGGGVAPGGSGGAGGVQVYNVTTYGVPSNGGNASALLAALIANTIGVGKATLYFPPGAYGLEANLNIPANVTVWMAKGAKFNAPVPGVTLTFNSDILAALDTIFDQSVNAFTVVSAGLGEVYPEWWGALCDGATNDHNALQKCSDSLTRGGKVRLSLGTYRNDAPWTITVDGITIEGRGYASPSVPVVNHPTVVDCSNTATGLDGITVIGGGASTLKGFKALGFFVKLEGAGAGGAAIKLWNCSAFWIDVVSSVQRGATSFGIQLSDTATVARACIAGEVRGIHVCNGTPVLVGFACTSVKVKTYTLGQSVAGVRIKGSNYIKLENCASDSSLIPNGYGYEIGQSNNVTLDTCGAENVARARLHITGGSIGVVDINGRGAGNNTDALAIASYAEIDAVGGSCYGIRFINPLDTAPNAATVFSIRAAAATFHTVIEGSADASSLAKGVGGDSVWMAAYLKLDSGLTPSPIVPNLIQAYGATANQISEAQLIAGVDSRQGSVRVTLTASRLVAAPSGMVHGQRLLFTIIQGGGGGWVTTWAAVFKKTWSDAGGGTLGARSSIEFIYDAVSATWNQVSAQAPYAP